MRLRIATQMTTAVIAGLFGLLTYEVVVMVGVAISIVLGLVNLWQIGRQAGAIKSLQEGQGARIDRLPPPPAG